MIIPNPCRKRSMARMKGQFLAIPSDPPTKRLFLPPRSNAQTKSLASKVSGLTGRSRRSSETLEMPSDRGYIMSDPQEPAHPSESVS